MNRKKIFSSISKLIGAIVIDYIENGEEDTPTIEDFIKLKRALERSPQITNNNSSYYLTFYKGNIRKDDKNRYHLYQGEL